MSVTDTEILKTAVWKGKVNNEVILFAVRQKYNENIESND